MPAERPAVQGRGIMEPLQADCPPAALPAQRRHIVTFRAPAVDSPPAEACGAALCQAVAVVGAELRLARCCERMSISQIRFLPPPSDWCAAAAGRLSRAAVPLVEGAAHALQKRFHCCWYLRTPTQAASSARCDLAFERLGRCGGLCRALPRDAHRGQYIHPRAP